MLNVSPRQGLSLVEIMLALVVTLIVTGATYSLLLQSQRVAREQGERVAVQSSIRAGALIVANELSELGAKTGGSADQNDILAIGSHAVTYRAMRGLGIICHAPGMAVIRLARNSFSGHRDPQAGRDEALVFVPGNPDTRSEDVWVPVKIVGVSTTSPCPGSLGPGITLTLSASPSTEQLLDAGTPVRLVEPVELRLYEAEQMWWLGARTLNTGEAIQPLAGPLTAEGFQLEYLDGVGTPTTDRTAIRTIRIIIRGALEGGIGRDRSLLHEELITQVTLRNSAAS